MKNLGKYLLFISLFSNTLFASLESHVDQTTVTQGELVTLTIKAGGQLISPPSITKLCGEKIASKSSATNIRSINGNFTKLYTLSYGFVATKSCIIQPISMEVDKKVVHTEAINITVKAPTQDKSADFLLEIKSDAKELYVGEPFKVVLTFKQRTGNRAVDSAFTPSSTDNFWVKKEEQGKAYQKDGFNITSITYILAPQRAGPQEITPAVMKIASRGNSRDAWGQWVSGLKWKSYFSNTLKFNVKPLPTDITLVGDFKITALVDKTTVDANEAVNLVVKISGDGNFEDIETLKPRIANASIFDEEPKVESQIENQNYRAQLTQKMAIISSEDFTIPPIVLKYFDPKEKLVKVLTTEAIKVHVNGGVVSSLNEEVKIQRADIHSTPVEVKTVSIERPFSMLYLILALFIGVMLGVTLSLLPWKKLLNKEKEQKMNLKDYKTLLVQLIPYKENSEVHKVISALEAHLYEGKELSIDKKVLKDMANRLRKDLL